MACMLKRPCRLNLAMAIDPMDCGSAGSSMLGSATPRQRPCEKRASPDSKSVCNPFLGKDFGVLSPNAVSPAADVILRQQAQPFQPSQLFQPAQPLRQEMAPEQEHCTKRMRRGSQGGGRRVVTFSGCSKPHDGLRPASRILDALVYGYFESQCISGPEDMRTLILEQFGGSGFATCEVMQEVHIKLTALCERVMELDDFCSMPVLIHGGGRGLQLQAVHRPHLRRLTKLFEQFVSGSSE